MAIEVPNSNSGAFRSAFEVLNSNAGAIWPVFQRLWESVGLRWESVGLRSTSARAFFAGAHDPNAYGGIICSVIAVQNVNRRTISFIVRNCKCFGASQQSTNEPRADESLAASQASDEFSAALHRPSPAGEVCYCDVEPFR